MKLVNLVALCMSMLGVGVVGCGDVSENSPASPVAPGVRNSSTTSSERQRNALIPYEVLTRKSIGNVKATYCVSVDLVDGWLPKDEEIAAISSFLRSKESQSANVFVTFYLPDMPIEGRGFAVAHHTPDPQKVLVFTDALPKRYYSLVLSESDSRRPPTHCNNISEMIDLVGEFSEADRTFRMLQNGPTPHFQISPTFVEGHPEGVIKETMKRDLVYMILSTFVHTDLSAVRVTAVPAVLTDFKTRKRTFQPSQSITLAVSRDDALTVLRKHAGVESFNDLCGVPFQGTYAPDLPTEIFTRCMYNDQGPPTLDLIFSQLSAASRVSASRP